MKNSGMYFISIYEYWELLKGSAAYEFKSHHGIKTIQVMCNYVKRASCHDLQPVTGSTRPDISKDNSITKDN